MLDVVCLMLGPLVLFGACCSDALLSFCSGVCIVNPAPTQRIMERDELIMMRPTAIGKNAYRGSPVPVAEVDISECIAVGCKFACVTLMASNSKHYFAHSDVMSSGWPSTCCFCRLQAAGRLRSMSSAATTLPRCWIPSPPAGG